MPSALKATVPTVIGRTPPKPVAGVHSEARDFKSSGGHISRHHNSFHAPLDGVRASTHCHRDHMRTTKSAGRQNVTEVFKHRPPSATSDQKNSSKIHGNGKQQCHRKQHQQLQGEYLFETDRRRRHSSSSTATYRPKLYPSLSVLKRVDEYVKAGREEGYKKITTKEIPRSLTPVNISDDPAYSTDHYINIGAVRKQLPALNSTKPARTNSTIALSSARPLNIKARYRTQAARDKSSQTHTEKQPVSTGVRPIVSKLHASFTTGVSGVDAHANVTSAHATSRKPHQGQYKPLAEELDEEDIRQLVRQVNRFKRAFFSIKRDEDSFRGQLNRLLGDNRALRRYYMALKGDLQRNYDRQADMTSRIDTVHGLLDEYCLPLLDTVRSMAREENKHRIQTASAVAQRRARSHSRPACFQDEEFLDYFHHANSAKVDDEHDRESRATSGGNRASHNEHTSQRPNISSFSISRRTPEIAKWENYAKQNCEKEYRDEHARSSRGVERKIRGGGDGDVKTMHACVPMNGRKDGERNAVLVARNNISSDTGNNVPSSEAGASSAIYVNVETLQEQALNEADEHYDGGDAARLRRRAERIRSLLLSEQPPCSSSSDYLPKSTFSSTNRENANRRRTTLVVDRLKKRLNERPSPEETGGARNFNLSPGEIAGNFDGSVSNASQQVDMHVSTAPKTVASDPDDQQYSGKVQLQTNLHVADKRLLRNKYREMAHRILRGTNSLDDLSTLAAESEKEVLPTAGLPVSRIDQQVGANKNMAVKSAEPHSDAPLQEVYASRYGGSSGIVNNAGGDADAHYNGRPERMHSSDMVGSGNQRTYYGAGNLLLATETTREKISAAGRSSKKPSQNFQLLAYREEQIERIRQICDENVEESKQQQLQQSSSFSSAPHMSPPVPPRRNNKPSKISSTFIKQQQQQQQHLRQEDHYMMTTPQNTPPTSSIGLDKAAVDEAGQHANSKIIKKLHASVLMTPKHNSDHAGRPHHRRANSPTPFDLAPAPPPRPQRAHELLFKRYHPAITTADGRLVYNVGVQTEPLLFDRTGCGLDDVDFQRQQHRQSDTVVLAAQKQQTADVGTDSNSPAKVSNTISTGSETQNQSTQTDSSLMTPLPPSNQQTITTGSSSQEGEHHHHHNNVRFNDERTDNFLYYNADNGHHDSHHRHHTHMPAPPTAPAASSGSSATPTTPQNIAGSFAPNENHQQPPQTVYCLRDEITPTSAAYNILARAQHQQPTRNVLHYPVAGQVPIFPISTNNSGNVLIVKRALKMKHFKHADKYILRCPDEIKIVQNNASVVAAPETLQPSALVAGPQKTNNTTAGDVEKFVMKENRMKHMGGILTLPAAVASAAVALAGGGGGGNIKISSIVVQSGSAVVETLPKSVAVGLERDQLHSSTRSTTSVKILQDQNRLSDAVGTVTNTCTMQSSLSSSNARPTTMAGGAAHVISSTPDSVAATSGGSRSLCAAPSTAAGGVATNVSTRNSKTTNLQDVSLSTVQFTGDVCPTKGGGYSIMFRSRTDNQVRMV